jgi:YfiH family protein
MISSPELAELGGIRHGFFTREGGHSTGLFRSLNCGLGSGDDVEAVRENRRTVSISLGVGNDDLLTLYQHHSPDVVVVDKRWESGRRPRADAMVTRKTNIALGVLTADCAPILFADRRERVVGAAHAGWKGALAGITDRTVEAMEIEGARRKNIVAVIGPTISQASYEVGPDFYAQFEAAEANSSRWFRPSERPFHYMFDLPGYIAERLRKAGIGSVVTLQYCTYCNEDRFFSYRRATHRKEKDYGRQISVISLAD